MKKVKHYLRQSVATVLIAPALVLLYVGLIVSRGLSEGTDIFAAGCDLMSDLL